MSAYCDKWMFLLKAAGMKAQDLQRLWVEQVIEQNKRLFILTEASLLYIIET